MDWRGRCPYGQDCPHLNGFAGERHRGRRFGAAGLLRGIPVAGGAVLDSGGDRWKMLSGRYADVPEGSRRAEP
jgi:hypothetical protein